MHNILICRFDIKLTETKGKHMFKIYDRKTMAMTSLTFKTMDAAENFVRFVLASLYYKDGTERWKIVERKSALETL